MRNTIKINTNQIKTLINKLSTKEKLDLARYLDNLTLKERWKNFLSSKKDIPVSFEEITKEVEKVRTKRYK